jgi:hypothetical protein
LFRKLPPLTPLTLTPPPPLHQHKQKKVASAQPEPTLFGAAKPGLPMPTLPSLLPKPELKLPTLLPKLPQPDLKLPLIPKPAPLVPKLPSLPPADLAALFAKAPGLGAGKLSSEQWANLLKFVKAPLTLPAGTAYSADELKTLVLVTALRDAGYFDAYGIVKGAVVPKGSPKPAAVAGSPKPATKPAAPVVSKLAVKPASPVAKPAVVKPAVVKPAVKPATSG